MMFKDFKINFKLFEIREGKFKILPTLDPKYVKGFIIVSIITFIIAGFSSQFKIDEKQLWKIYTALIERLGLKSQVPDIKDNEKKLDAEIELKVDTAIREYERLTGDDGRVRIPAPRYSEKPVDTDVCYTDECRSLGGEMRICSPWVDSCPKQ
jgi:hypothetical protein